MRQEASRRSFLATAFGATAIASPPQSYRVAVIGHTGHGNYGHGIDLVWNSLAQTNVVAVADADAAGRAAAVKRIHAARGYADYRQMLLREKPDLVGIGPRWLDEREQMVIAAAEAGAHIFTEKPFARSPAEADRIVEAVRKNRVKVQVAHQMRVSPYTLRAKAMVDAGELGDIQEVRARGKEDRRAGGEDLMVLGSHLFDMMRFFLGDPKWVVSHVTTNGEELSARDARQATEPHWAGSGKSDQRDVRFPQRRSCALRISQHWTDGPTAFRNVGVREQRSDVRADGNLSRRRTIPSALAGVAAR
jgi:predicted dehydrogenase